MKAKDTLLFNNIITQNPVLARRASFWHVAYITVIMLSHFLYFQSMGFSAEDEFLGIFNAKMSAVSSESI